MYELSPYAKVLTNISLILKKPEFVECVKHMKAGASAITDFQKWVDSTLSSPACDLFRNGFLPDEEQIGRLVKIYHGYEKLNALNEREKKIFLVYHRTTKLSTFNQILTEYADMSLSQIENNINILRMDPKQLREVGLTDSFVRQALFWIFSLILGAAVEIGLSEIYELTVSQVFSGQEEQPVLQAQMPQLQSPKQIEEKEQTSGTDENKTNKKG